MTAKDFWREFRLLVSGPLSEWHPPDMVYNYAEAYAARCTAQMREALEKISLHGLSGDPNHHRSYLVERLIAVRKIAAAALSGSGEPLRNHCGMSAERLTEIESVIEDSRYDIMPSVREMLSELTKAMRSGSGEHAPGHCTCIISFPKWSEDRGSYCANCNRPIDDGAKISPSAQSSGEHAQDDDGWVKISDRIPELNEPVLVFDGSIDIAYRRKNPGLDGYWWQLDSISLTQLDVTHWRPLPSAPRKEG